MTTEEIDEYWRKATVENGKGEISGEHWHIQRLFRGGIPTLVGLFKEGATVNCVCGKQMASYAEFLKHQDSAREYYRGMLLGIRPKGDGKR